MCKPRGVSDHLRPPRFAKPHYACITWSSNGSSLMDALLLHRLHFAFTITYHYLFSQLTMGLALLVVVLKTVALVRHNERYNEAARFWAKIFAINFLIGVVTGIPME